MSRTATQANLKGATPVFLVGNIEETMEWYKRLGFASRYFPPGFAILHRGPVEIFLQQQPGYQQPDDPGRQQREAWDVYIVTDDVRTLYEEFSAQPGVRIARAPCPQEYGMLEFDVLDLNERRLVFAEAVSAR